MLSAIDTLSDLAHAITDQQLRRAERKLSPIHSRDKAMGIAHNMEARKWWALARVLKAQSDSWEHKAEWDCDSDEEQKSAEQEAVRLHQMAALAQEIFWYQVREDTGGSAWDKDRAFGVREGWQLVSVPVSDGRQFLGLGGLGGLFTPHAEWSSEDSDD